MWPSFSNSCWNLQENLKSIVSTVAFASLKLTGLLCKAEAVTTGKSKYSRPRTRVRALFPICIGKQTVGGPTKVKHVSLIFNHLPNIGQTKSESDHSESLLLFIENFSITSYWN